MAKKEGLPMEDPRLQAAVKELLAASQDFRRAYELWSHAPDEEFGWERLRLDEAQTRLDRARDKVNEVEVLVRRLAEGKPPRGDG